jgi:hypothetical protein
MGGRDSRGGTGRREESRLQLPPQGSAASGGHGGSARKKGWDLGTGAVSRERREQVVACLSAQLFCVPKPERERDRSSWEEKKQHDQGTQLVLHLSHRS